MKIDRNKVLDEFKAYTDGYDPEDPKIALKIEHTYHVADNCERIAASEGFSKEDIDLAWLSGILHDIGRFEQAKRFNSFNDSKTVDHAELGADLLFGEKALIQNFTDDRSCDEMLETVIRQHNKYRIDSKVTGKTKKFCDILRDADKVDIIRVNVEMPMEEIYNMSREELLSSGVSKKVMDEVREHRTIRRDLMSTSADHLIGHIALTFELVYPKSLQLVREQGFLDKTFDFPSKNETTLNALKETRLELEKWAKSIQ